MLPDKCNLITTKATGLIFALFNVASAPEIPFGIPQYVQYILHGLTSVLLCVPFIFSKVSIWWYHVMANGNCPYFLLRLL